MAKQQSFRKGDRVEWNTPQGRTIGRVMRKVTSRTHAEGPSGGHDAAASKDAPQYVVKSEKSRKEAIHRASALRKKD